MRRPTTLAALLFLGLASSAGVGSYTVRPGDTLAAIADRVGSSVDALVKANAIANPNLIVTGAVLKVPGTAAAAPAPETVVTVKPGDTLAVLASRLGTTVEALAGANGIRNPNVI